METEGYLGPNHCKIETFLSDVNQARLRGTQEQCSAASLTFTQRKPCLVNTHESLLESFWSPLTIKQNPIPKISFPYSTTPLSSSEVPIYQDS